MEENKASLNLLEETLKLSDNNTINLKIINDTIKIEITYNEKDFLGIFSQSYFKVFDDFYDIVSSIIGIKEIISKRITTNKYSIIYDSNILKLKLLFNDDKTIELLIPSKTETIDNSLENIIRLETEYINLNNKINTIKKDLKIEIKKELKNELLEEINQKEKENQLNNINENISQFYDNARPKVLFYQKLEYISSLLIDQKSLTEIPYYTKEFETDNIYNIVQVNINIPYSFVDIEWGRGKILTYLDDEMINDSTILNRFTEIRPLTILGYVQNLQKGKHKIKILACVDKGNLNLPHINKSYLEYTIPPIVSGSIIVIGF